MKSQAVILIALLLTSFFAAGTTVKAQPALTPHEDPSTTQSAIDAYSFLEQYATIFALISNKQYENASQLSEQLSHITVPADLSYVTSRYNNLTQQLITVLNDLQTTLDTVSTMLDQNQLSKAQEQLDRAGVLVAKAQILLEDLKDATAILSQKLGVFAASAESKVWQAYNQLQSMIDKLNELIELYHKLLQEANQRADGIISQNLGVTTLSLALNSTKCFVGGYIIASGALTSEGKPLGNRVVKLLLDGEQVATSSTNTNGHYYTTIKIPYKYIDPISVSATYVPEGNDKNKYLAASSPAIKVQVLFYKTTLEISASDTAYPGLQFTINGKVTAQDETPQSGRQVTILLDNSETTHVETNQNGTFTTKFTVDIQIQLGNHTLTVTAEANGLYAPTTEQIIITVQKMTTQLQADVPTFILLPAQIEITGKVSAASGPLKEATIQIEYSNITATTQTYDDGSFNLTIAAPLNTALAGNQELIVKAQPSQPWQSTTQITKNIFAINSVSTSVALASSFSLFAVAYIRFTKAKKTEKVPLDIKTINVSLESIENDLVSIQPVANEAMFNGSKGKILKAYVEALAAVQTFTNNPLTSNMTLREYTQVTQPKIEHSAVDFKELTGLAEKSLYSPHEPQPKEIEKAEELSKTVRRKLNADR